MGTDHLLHLIRDMRLEEAVAELRAKPGAMDRIAVEAMAREWEREAESLRARGETGEARRRARRALALRRLLAHGPDPGRMVAEVDLPEGYRGKIVLVLVKGGGFEGTVCLRSGDDWHREILRNVQAELLDLGFPSARAYALGGAYAGFDGDRIIDLGDQRRVRLLRQGTGGRDDRPGVSGAEGGRRRLNAPSPASPTTGEGKETSNDSLGHRTLLVCSPEPRTLYPLSVSDSAFHLVDRLLEHLQGAVHLRLRDHERRPQRQDVAVDRLEGNPPLEALEHDGLGLLRRPAPSSPGR